MNKNQKSSAFQAKDQYVEALKIDNKIALERQRSYVIDKTRQQAYLEELIEHDDFQFKDVADVACGGGAPRLLAE